jgi:hypothetical protein
MIPVNQRIAEQNAEVRIIVDPASLTRSSKGQIFGTIYIELVGEAFPDSMWSDSVVVILGWWLTEMTDLKTCGRSKAKFLFMDGPFRAELALDDHGHCSLELFRQSNLRASAIIDASQLEESLLKAAHVIDRACFEREWHSTELRQLRSAIQTLVQLRTSNRTPT